MPIGELAKKLNGKLLGDPAVIAGGICALNEPQESFICFARTRAGLENVSFDSLRKTAAVLVDSLDAAAVHPGLNYIVVPDPQSALLSLVEVFYIPIPKIEGINPKSDIHPSVKLGSGVCIGAFTSIGENCLIEDDVVIFPHVTIYPGVTIGRGSIIHAAVVIREDCQIGAASIIHSGSIIGADGFGYLSRDAMAAQKIPHLGTARLGDRVEIGANSCIDRATFGTTSIGDDTKIDNLVQIGHNCRLGKQVLLCGQVGLAGSSSVGDRAVLGGKVGVGNHVVIGSDIRVAAISGVSRDIREPGDYGGYPAVPVSQWRRQITSLRRLPAILKQLKIRTNGEED